MNFVKQKATTKKPKIMVSNFEEMKSQYLMDVKAFVTVEEIPDDMVLHWDETAIKYILLSNWTMDKEGSKQVEVVSIDDKRQITAVCQITATFAVSFSEHFLPVQM